MSTIILADQGKWHVIEVLQRDAILILSLSMKTNTRLGNNRFSNSIFRFQFIRFWWVVFYINGFSCIFYWKIIIDEKVWCLVNITKIRIAGNLCRLRKVVSLVSGTSSSFLFPRIRISRKSRFSPQSRPMPPLAHLRASMLINQGWVEGKVNKDEVWY